MISIEWFCVSSTIREDLLLDKQLPHAQAPPSVMSMSKKKEVDVCRFNTKILLLDGTLNEYGGIANLAKAKGAREQLHAIAGGEVGTGTGQE